MTQPKVAIVGAGPAGCTLARLLYLADIPVTVFEGLAALQEAKLFDEFLKHARYDSDLLQLADKNLKIVLRKAGSPVPIADEKQPRMSITDQRPEIDRAELRRLLAESLPEGMIQWSKHLTRVEPIDSEGKHALVFADGITASDFDLVVGADGAWSKVRALLDPDHYRPAFSKVGAHEMTIPDAPNTAPKVYAAVGRGSLFAYADGVKLALQQMGEGNSINVYASLTKTNENWADPEVCGFDPQDSEATRKALLEGVFKDWHPTLREAVEKATARSIPRSMYQLPVGYRWQHKKGITLIGDAAHLMTPYAGEGVNQALEDALELARAIVGALGKKESANLDSETLDDAICSFEKVMWPRAEKVARLTNDLLEAWMFTPGTPDSVIAKTTAMHVRFHTPWLVHPIATIGVHAYFLLRRLFG